MNAQSYFLQHWWQLKFLYSIKHNFDIETPKVANPTFLKSQKEKKNSHKISLQLKIYKLSLLSFFIVHTHFSVSPQTQSSKHNKRKKKTSLILFKDDHISQYLN